VVCLSFIFVHEFAVSTK